VAGLGLAGQGTARRGMAGVARHGRHGKVGHGMVGLGVARRGMAGVAGHGRRGVAGQGMARRGMAWRGRIMLSSGVNPRFSPLLGQRAQAEPQKSG